jgi:hypothetical protein
MRRSMQFYCLNYVYNALSHEHQMNECVVTYLTARNMGSFKSHPSLNRYTKMLLHERCKFRSF